MKYLDEFRDPRAARKLADRILATATRRRKVMEICGGQTHTLVRHGIDRVLEPVLDLIHGPGCPVCVTPLEKIDRALAIAAQPGTTLASFGDMLRVPGSDGDLLQARARGAEVRIVYSPLDAVELAARQPDRQVVFFAVGFETTAPANAMAVRVARDRRIENFSVLVSHVRVPPAIRVVMNDPESRVEGFVAPGHVCAVMGSSEYEELARQFRVPFVVAGFEPLDLLQGLWMLVDALERGATAVENQYTRSVRPEGNPAARAAIDDVFEACDAAWRGIGIVPSGGMRLRAPYAEYDAETRFEVGSIVTREHEACVAGAILQGRLKPCDCPAFGTACRPEHPLGAPMVSSEGACAAYHAFRAEPAAFDRGGSEA